MNHPVRGCLALALLALVLVPAFAFAWGSFSGPYARLTGALPDGANGAFVVWDYWDDNFNPSIRGQRLSPGGNVMWAPNPHTIANAGNIQDASQAASDGAGGIYVAFRDQRYPPPGNEGVYVQRMDANGVVLWAANGIRFSPYITPPTIVSNGIGGAVVAWVDNHTGNAEVWAQRIGPDGSALWAPGGVQVTATGGNEGTLLGATGIDGHVILAWSLAGGSPLIAQALDSTGTKLWGTDGVALEVPTATIQSRALRSDGAGGVIAAWTRSESGGSRTVSTQRLDATGAPLWGGGSAITVYDGTAGDASAAAVAADGVGGAFIGWSANSYAIQNVSALGTAAWAANGVVVGTRGNAAPAISLSTDGAGNVAAAWTAFSSSPFGFTLRGQMLDASGAQQWGPGGVEVINTSFFDIANPILTPTTNNSWIVVYRVNENSSASVQAYRLDHFGYVGDPAPVVQSVSDVPSDEGGIVNVTWARSFLDRSVNRVVTEYRLFRETQASTSRARPARAADPGWELVATVTANSSSGYSVATASHGDDVGGVHPVTNFRVEAHSSSAGTDPKWNSGVLGGWSVDNVAPPTPTGFGGSYESGTISLNWDASPASDIGVYRIYRGTEGTFTPAPGNQVGETSATNWTDEPGDAYFYKLGAVDVHGNASGFTDAIGPGVTGVGVDPTLTFALGLPRPNPVRDFANIHFAMPAAGNARLVLFDLAGRGVATLHDGPLTAGAHHVTWSPSTARGLASGIYVLRLEAGGRTVTRRMVITR